MKTDDTSLEEALSFEVQNRLTMSVCFCIFTVDLIWFPCLAIIHKKKLRTLYRNIITGNTKSLCCVTLVNSKFGFRNILRTQCIDSIEKNKNWSCQFLTIIRTSPYNKKYIFCFGLLSRHLQIIIKILGGIIFHQ